MKESQKIFFIILYFILGFIVLINSIKNETKIKEVTSNEFSQMSYYSLNEDSIIIEESDPYEEIETEYIEKMNELESIADENLKQWYMEYKEMISKYSDLIGCPETIYDYYDEDELDMLFRVVQAEIGDEWSFIQKCNVASVIFNRLEHDRFESEMFKVLTKDQFSTVASGRYTKVDVSDDTILACEFAFEIKDTTNGCLFFDSNGSLRYEFSFNDGAHNFYKLKEE